jgi:retron-type reverse transcriptase
VVKTKNGLLKLYETIFVLPYFLNVDHLASYCGISPSQLHLFISNKRKAYSTFKLPKKRGGIRTIDAPSKKMKLVQRWILDNILYKLNPGEYAHGFIPKKSIVTNASVHVGQNLVLGIDLKDFFPSITLSRVIGLFRSIGYTEEVSHVLGELCTFNWRLPQGAPTSPMISNLIAWNMDLKLSKFCQKRNLNYSRYADDITISGGKDLPRYKTLIFHKIEDEGFKINWDKVRLHDRGSSQRVTGLVVNEKVTLGRKKKKWLRAIVHNIVNNGHLAENKDNDPFFKERIFGHLALAKMVEPDFAESLLDSLKGVDWDSYYENLADLKKSELVVRSLEKKYYYNPDFESQDIKLETDLLNVVFFFIEDLKHHIEDRRWNESFWDDERELEMD